MADNLNQRVEAKRKAEGLSFRKLGKQTGVAFSLLAKAALNPEHEFSLENRRKLRLWLGDDVSRIIPAATALRAEELGRMMARACQDEILAIIKETHNG